MIAIRLTVAAVMISTLCEIVHAQEEKPCPSGHICPVCSEDNGIRTCKVHRPGPALPQAVLPAAPLDISPPSAGAPSSSPPRPPVFQFGPFIIPLR
jgi:hypothetical protein